jgi:hypothetical protein
MRDGEVVQPGNVPQRERQIHGGLTVRTIKDSVFGGVLVGEHIHMEGRLNGRDRAFNLNFHAIARAANHSEAALLNISHHGVVIGLRGAKPGGELRRSKEVPVVGDGRAVEVGQESVEAGLIA